MEQQNQQSIQEEKEIKHPIKANWRYITIVALIAVVVAVAGILLLKAVQPSTVVEPAPSPQPQGTNNQQSAIDTSGWQTYRNEEFGFDMRYPTDWSVEIDELFFEDPIDEIKSSKTESLITVSEMENPENLSFDDWVGRLSLLADDPLTRPIGEYATFANGVRAYRFDSYPSDRPFAEISEIFIENPTGRIIDIYATSEVREDRDVVNQILSTFRFMDDVKKDIVVLDSGIMGTTSSFVVGGVPPGQKTGGATSLEFAVAPMEGDSPAYHKAILVKSDKEGKFEVVLSPGKYWIGPKEKALDPINYVLGPFVFSEKTVVVEKGIFAKVDISLVGYAP